jgi:crotonobetainyl-CoA:carnitine CoA-transferase CaiB-like acyl-CoA transferase
VQAGTRLGLDESAHERSAPSGGAAQGPRGVTPLRGTHNQAVYAAAGFSSDEIEKLAAEGVL